MYVACRHFKVAVPGKPGSARDVKPGDEVPEALTWDYSNLIAHLNLEWLKWSGKAVAKHDEHRNKAVVIPLIFKKMAPKDSTVDPHRVTEGPDSTPVGQARLSCEKCEGRAFRTEAALQAHNRVKHSKAG